MAHSGAFAWWGVCSQMGMPKERKPYVQYCVTCCKPRALRHFAARQSIFVKIPFSGGFLVLIFCWSLFLAAGASTTTSQASWAKTRLLHGCKRCHSFRFQGRTPRIHIFPNHAVGRCPFSSFVFHSPIDSLALQHALIAFLALITKLLTALLTSTDHRLASHSGKCEHVFTTSGQAGKVFTRLDSSSLSQTRAA